MVDHETESKQTFFFLGLLGLVGALMTGTGEFLLHFNAQGYQASRPFGFLASVSSARLGWGHFLAVLSLPLYWAGYRHVYLALRPAGRRVALAATLTGVYGLSLGHVWLGSRALLARMVQAQVEATGGTAATLEALVGDYDLYNESLIQIVRIAVLASSLLMIGAIWKGGGRYPRWMFFNVPIVWLALIFLCYFVWPALGKYLVPTAMNVAHVLFFSLSLWVSMGRR